MSLARGGWVGDRSVNTRHIPVVRTAVLTQIALGWSEYIN